MGSRVTLFVAPASRAGTVWFVAHVLITLVTTTQAVAYIIRFQQVFPFQENWPLSYLTYAVLEGYLLYVAAAIYRRRWHAASLITAVNIAALAAASVATYTLVTFHPITYFPDYDYSTGKYRVFNQITFNSVIEVSWYINLGLSGLLAITSLYTAGYVLSRPDADRWSQSMYTLAPTQSGEVEVRRLGTPSRLITLAIQAMHTGIFLISARFAWAFLRQGPRYVPQALRQLLTEPDARRALGKHTAEFVFGMVVVSWVWAVCTAVFVGICALVLVYAYAVSRRQYDHKLLKNKVHIPLVLLGIIPAWLIGDSPLPWRTAHNLLVTLGSLFFATALTEILFTLTNDDSDRWNKSVYDLCADPPFLPLAEAVEESENQETTSGT